MAYLNGKPIFFSPHVNIKYPDIIVKSWADVQAVVRDGKAKKAFSIGDQFKCGHGDYGLLTWDVIGIDHDTPSDPNFTHSITLQLHDCFPSSQIRTHNTDHDTWKDSYVRHWLNVPTDKYTRPSWATGIVYNHCFMYNLDEEFLAVVGEVEKKTRSRDGETLDTTSDLFFLLSCEEVYGASNGIYALGEGTSYQYYLDRTQHSVPSRSPDAGRIKYKGYLYGNQIVGHEAVHGWGLRSPANDHADFAVFRDGFITTTESTAELDRATFMAPACCIY